MLITHITTDGRNPLCGSSLGGLAVLAIDAHRALEEGEYCKDCQAAWQEVCPHPIRRVFAWIVDDPGGQLLCLGCSDCGKMGRAG